MRRHLRRLGCILAAGIGGCDNAPSFMRPRGPVAGHEALLGWILTAIAIVVVLVITGLVLAAALKRRRDESDIIGPVRGETRWIILGGFAFPSIVLVLVFLTTMITLRTMRLPPEDAIALEITGHQWWWEIRYGEETTGFTTANEIHIPVGRPVQVRLNTADVIHSFWVPELAGKLDLIPGQENTMWLQADTAGIYWGQCAEYCGKQHAHMGIEVVAESVEDFERWRAEQRAPAAEPDDRDAWLGKQVFRSAGCAGCHTIRGTDAQGILGPDLTHVASRRTLAAGAIPNTRGWLAGWIVNAQSLKPGVLMPDVPLAAEELQAVLAYVEQLR